MKLFVPFELLSKADSEDCVVEGYASTEALDSQGEIVKRDALERALPDYMKFANIREMHQQSAVGVAVSAEHDEKGLRLRAHIVDPTARKKVEAGVYKGFSIGGRVTDRDKANKAVITGLHLTEISLVDRPANPEALFDVWKAEAGEPVTKGMMAVASLANIVQMVDCLSQSSAVEEAKEGDADSDVPQKLKDALAQLMDTLNDMVAEETAEIASGTDAPEGGMLFMAEGAGDIEKKDYTEAERKDMSSDGRAMPDGGFPISNRTDLENAIKALGRAKDKAAARAHIEHRAKELGLTDLIPDGWAEKADLDADIEKRGARISADDQEKLNAAHDSIVAAGAQCDAMKHESPSDLTKANADLVTELAKAQTQLATVEGSLASITADRDQTASTLADLTKVHAATTEQRNDLQKKHDELAAAKTAVDEELVSVKAELENIKAQPEPMKGKVLAVAKGDDVNPAAAGSTQKLPSEASLPKDRPPTWFNTRPVADQITVNR